MPELPEVEAVVRSLREDGAGGLKIVSTTVHRASSIRPQSPREFAKACAGRIIIEIERRAKNILLHLSGDKTIRVHLRMTGDLMIRNTSSDEKAVRIAWKLSDGRRLLFMDPRALGTVHVSDRAAMQDTLQHLGVEPLSQAFTAKQLFAMAQKSQLPAKLFLMDQTKVAGLGNIDVAEALFRGGVSPTSPMNTVKPEKIAALHGAIRKMLRSAIQSVYKAYRSPGGYRNHRDDFLRLVYGQAGKPCQVCGAAIERIRQAGRSTYFCSHCQC